jgi:hypothetical protein
MLRLPEWYYSRRLRFHRLQRMRRVHLAGKHHDRGLASNSLLSKAYILRVCEVLVEPPP